MKCPNCDADILEDIKKCPFCRQPIQEKEMSSHREKERRVKHKGTVDTEREREFDFTYTITSQEQIDLIRQAVADLEQSDGAEKSTEVEISVTRTPKNMNFEEELRKIKEEVSENYHIRPQKKELPLQGKIEEVHEDEKKPLFSSVFSRLPREKKRKKKYRISMRGRRVIFLGVCAAAAICLALSGVKLLGNLFSRDSVVIQPAYFVKDNTLLQYKNGSSAVLTEQLYVGENSDDVMSETTLAQPSDNGEYVYYFENFDASSKSGDLMVCSIRKTSDKTKIASSVSENILISDDGRSVLFIQNGNIDGNMGTLQYWSRGMQEIWKIASDMDGGNFVFSQNGKQVLFIEKFNTTTRMGDLYLMDLRKEAQRQKIDSDVCEVFGTDISGKRFIYGQNYNAADKSYDLYVKTMDSEKHRIADHTALPPIISEKNTRVYAYGAFESDTHNLYRIDLNKNESQKIASDITEIIAISKDETQVLFNKVYNTGFADYYIYTEGKEPVKVADNVNSFTKTDHAIVSQFAFSKDFSRIAYISGFDPAKESGALYVSRYRKGKPVRESKKITDEAYSCSVSQDGNTVWYASNFSVSRKIVDLYLYNQAESLKVADEIAVGQFSFGKVGNTITYLTDFNIDTGCGRLTISNKKLEKVQVADDIAAFSLKMNDDVIFLKEYNQTEKTFDLCYAASNGSATSLVESGVRRLLSY